MFLVGFGPTMAKTYKVATKSRHMIDNEPRQLSILDINAKYLAKIFSHKVEKSYDSVDFSSRNHKQAR